MAVQLSGNSGAFGYHSLGTGAGVTHSPLAMPTQGPVNPSSDISGSVSYINDMQAKGSQNKQFQAGQQEGHGSGFHMPNPLGGGAAGEGESAAGDAEGVAGEAGTAIEDVGVAV